MHPFGGGLEAAPPKRGSVSESQCGVEEHRAVGRSQTVRDGGRGTRENAGMSSENEVRIFIVESLRFPGEGSSAQGKSGPKPRACAVGDGQLVEIPVPPDERLTDAVTQKDRQSGPMEVPAQALRQTA